MDHWDGKALGSTHGFGVIGSCYHYLQAWTMEGLFYMPTQLLVGFLNYQQYQNVLPSTGWITTYDSLLPECIWMSDVFFLRRFPKFISFGFPMYVGQKKRTTRWIVRFRWQGGLAAISSLGLLFISPKEPGFRSKFKQGKKISLSQWTLKKKF